MLLKQFKYFVIKRKKNFCYLTVLQILLLEVFLQIKRVVWLIYLSTLPVYSVVNKMLALKGENNCKYKHGEVHLELEQTCFSDSLTVTWGWIRFQNHCPTGHTLSCFVWLIHIHTHIHINRHTHAHTHGSPQRGHAGKEAVSGWAAVRSSRNIWMFPLQQTASISGDRQSDIQVFSLTLSLCVSVTYTHRQMHSHTHRQWLTERWTDQTDRQRGTFCTLHVGRGTTATAQWCTIPLDTHTHRHTEIKSLILSVIFLYNNFDTSVLKPILGLKFKFSNFTFFIQFCCSLFKP